MEDLQEMMVLPEQARARALLMLVHQILVILVLLDKETREGGPAKVVVVEAQASLLRQMVTGLVAVAAVEQVQSIRGKTQLTVALVVEALAVAAEVVMVLLIIR